MNHPLPDCLHSPRLRVGSRWLSTSTSFPVHNPATGTLLAEVPLGDPTTLDEATQAALDAFEITRREPAHLRASRLNAIADALHAQAEPFAHLLVAEAGKPIRLAHLEVSRAILTFQLAAEAARKQQGTLLDLDATPPGTHHFGITRRFPIGPIAALSPFNFPLNLVAHKLAPAIASGNTILLKPSPRTPLSALFLASIVEAAGTPPGQFNVLTCPHELVGPWISDPRIRMLSFTGSAQVGWALQRQASGKRCTLELGGNAPVLVHSDADLDTAVPLIAQAAFAFAGQTCISVQRVLVHASVYAPFTERLLAYTQSQIRVGDPTHPEVLVGPMIDQPAASRTLQAITESLQHGARLLCGGTAHGSTVFPTILEAVPHHLPLWAEEAFAPVLVLQPYTSFDEALHLANTSRYGLQAGLFTRDMSLAWNAFCELEVGAVLINQVPAWRVENMPYGGVKASGLGREGISSAIEEMTEPKSWIWNTTR